MIPDITTHLEDADRLLVFGGPYSNLQATQAMRRKASELGIPAKHTLCTGDVVAYCANPLETIAEIRNWGIHVVAGNCEQQLAAGADNCDCGYDEGSACDRLSKGWYGYADARVPSEDRRWMGGLSDEICFTWAGKRVRTIHGALNETNRFLFASQHDVLDQQLATGDADLILAGHSGIPFYHMANSRLWLNAGVIGQPANDGTPDVWYGLLTREDNDVRATLHRLTYDHETASRAILDAGYADPYGTTLATGIWPNTDILPKAETAMQGVRLPELTAELPPTNSSQEHAA